MSQATHEKMSEIIFYFIFKQQIIFNEVSGLDLHQGVNVVAKDPNIMGQLWDKTYFEIVIFFGTD